MTVPSGLRHDGGRRRRRRRLAALLAVPALLVTFLPALTLPAAAGPVSAPARAALAGGQTTGSLTTGSLTTGGLTTGNDEIRQAKATGEPVEIASERTETTQVFADPDGNQRMVVSLWPRWVKKGDTWAGVDLGLMWRGDGTLGPYAAPVDMTFSGGGDGPLVRIVKDGVTLTYTWPAPLPKPSPLYETATYEEVFPGVDLKLTAGLDGFSQVLVVKTPEAARDPRLAEIPIGIQVSGGTLGMDATGNVTVRDPGGKVVLHGNAPQMWDSSGAEEDAKGRVTGPLTGDAIGTVAARLDGGTLVLTPDQDFLRTPGLTYPVYVDPPMYGAGRLAFAYVSKHFASTKYYGTSDVAKVGYYNDPYVPSGPTTDTYRSFFRMNTSAVNGKHIVKATFRAYETYSWSCSAREVQLWLTGSIGTGTTWNAQPAWKRKIASASVAKGYSSSCGAGGVDFDATSAVTEAASNNWANLTLGLRAASESDKYGWKKFRNNPSIEITYNTTPNVPDQLSTQVGASAYVPCATGTAAPHVTTLTPTLRATVTDADGAKGQTVRAHFEWYVIGGAKVGEHYTSYVASGTPVTAPLSVTDGARISWRVRAQDGVATSGTSGWGGWCDVIVDRTRPSAAPGVASTDYPETPAGGDPVPAGGVGRMGVFRLSPGTVTDAWGYLYALNSDDPGTATAVNAAADGTATIKVTPPRDLLNVLYVWIRDKAGNIGPYKRYEFSVRRATSPVAIWTLDETSGTVAGDSSGNGYQATLSTGATRTPGRVSGAVRLDGAGGTVTASKPDGIIRTDQNFSVAAWVRLTDKGTYRTVLSQDGVNRAGFSLQYHVGSDRWAMAMGSADSVGSPTYYHAKSDAAPVTGRWTHLAASFDAATGRLLLFVDGRPQSTTAVQPTPWNAAGRFVIGRALGGSEQWAGDVDDVRVWDRVVYDKEVGDLANRPVSLEGHWKLDETSGPVARDSSGKPSDLVRDADATGACTWTGGWVGGAAGFGAAGCLIRTKAPLRSGAGPVLRTDGSFTVAAYVRLTDKADYRTAVSMDGVNRSGFYLQYDKAQDRWRFNMPTADSTSAVYTGPFSIDPAETGVWTHLAGVYDRANNQLRLYVDGNLEGTTSFTTPWQTKDALTIGQAINGWNKWVGEIDDVRAYTGVLSDDEIYELSLQ
ncbi:LamG-like jellyroll fold domain-containing protein [Microbispora sp. H11081]|uniref:LamG-like jellyroll fold domain-containing protein n=1 Tax=Microbispora sp. H11081 TaxID=2729107 RepID=UPI0014766F12|nr:LamG-like jellyroll fold domain-containing protein [Microbispora sp. H11081]